MPQGERQHGENRQLTCKCFCRSHANLWAYMDICACIRISCNAATYGIDNAKDKGALATGQLDGGKGIGGFATLRDSKDHIIRVDDRIPVSELRGILNLHWYLAEGFEELFANETCVPTGATGHNDEPASFQQSVAIEVDC